MQSNYPSPYTLFSPILCSTLISLPKILLFGFFFFPFPLISKTGLLNCVSLQHRSKRKRIYQKTVRFVKYLLLFSFYFFKFFSSVRKKQNISNAYRLHTETSKRIIEFCCSNHHSVLSTPTCNKQFYQVNNRRNWQTQRFFILAAPVDCRAIMKRNGRDSTTYRLSLSI